LSISVSALTILLLVALGLTLAPATAGADWNTGVGGNAARNGLTAEIGPGAPDLLWQGSRPAIVSQQGVAAGNLFVVPRIQSFTIPTGTWIVAHDLTSGDELWAVQLPFDNQNPSHRSRVTAIRDGQVYATRAGNSLEDFLYALDPVDGHILWTSAEKIDERSTESLAFADNGDLIVGNFNSVRRIDRTDGSTVWDEPRTCPSSDGCSAAVFGDRVYIWEASGSGPKVTAFDLSSGARLYSSAGFGGLVQQLGLLVGPDGTVYAPRTQNNVVTDFFIALEDTGAALVEKWRVPLGYVPFSSYGIGPDGSVYSYTPSLEVVRLDPANGDTLNLSMPIPHDFPAEPRMAIDSEGKIYLTNGSFDQGRLFSFNADLTLRWSEDVFRVNLGGPVLGMHGTLVVCGTGTNVRAYRSSISTVAAVRRFPGGLVLEQNVPNPFNPRTEIGFELEAAGRVTLEVLDAKGRRLRTLIGDETRSIGRHTASWDGLDDGGAPAPSGVYFYRIASGSRVDSRKMLLVK
jgi:outer membrane protein assembly factor BamB